MTSRLLPGERRLREGAANLQRGAESVGGALLLTDRRLVFEPHGLNLHTRPEEIPLDGARGVRACWTRLLGVLPVAPNAIEVYVSRLRGKLAGTGTRISTVRAVGYRLEPPEEIAHVERIGPVS